MPGTDGESISRKGAVLERGAFEQMKTEYYHLRGWDSESGLQTRTKLIELGLSDIVTQEDMQGLLR